MSNGVMCQYHSERHSPTHCKWCGQELCKGSRRWYCEGWDGICGMKHAGRKSWNVAKALAYKLQGARCVFCGGGGGFRHGEGLQVHHIREVNGQPRTGLLNDQENLVVLCQACHRDCHHPPQTAILIIETWGQFRVFPKAKALQERLNRSPDQPNLFEAEADEKAL